MTIRIEPATPERWQDWRRLRLRALAEDPDAFGATYEAEAGFDEATWRSRLDGSSGPAALALAGPDPVGMGAGWLHEPGRLMVVAMWTEPAWRGRGVGHGILDQVVGWARGRGIRCELWVADDNPGARRLYERYGFRGDGLTGPLREGSALRKSHLVL